MTPNDIREFARRVAETAVRLSPGREPRRVLLGVLEAAEGFAAELPPPLGAGAVAGVVDAARGNRREKRGRPLPGPAWGCMPSQEAGGSQSV